MQYDGRVLDALENRGPAGVRDFPFAHELDAQGRAMPARGENCEMTTRDTRGLESSDLADVFFGQDNLDALQDGLRWRVYVESGQRHVISRQSDTELKIIMRSIYLQHGENRPTDILQQVQALNMQVLQFCVPRILAEIAQYLQYQRDVSTLPMPMERSENVSNKGSRVLELRL